MFDNLIIIFLPRTVNNFLYKDKTACTTENLAAFTLTCRQSFQASFKVDGKIDSERASSSFIPLQDRCIIKKIDLNHFQRIFVKYLNQIHKYICT